MSVDPGIRGLDRRAATPAAAALARNFYAVATAQRRPFLSLIAFPSMKSELSNGLSAHILPTSATMIGVCMTVVSLVKIVHLNGSGSGVLIDKLLAADSLIFLASAILSFMSMQRGARERAARLERWAEATFLFALGLVAIAAVMLAFEIV